MCIRDRALAGRVRQRDARVGAFHALQAHELDQGSVKRATQPGTLGPGGQVHRQLGVPGVGRPLGLGVRVGIAHHASVLLGHEVRVAGEHACDPLAERFGRGRLFLERDGRVHEGRVHGEDGVRVVGGCKAYAGGSGSHVMPFRWGGRGHCPAYTTTEPLPSPMAGRCRCRPRGAALSRKRLREGAKALVMTSV